MSNIDDILDNAYLYLKNVKSVNITIMFYK